MSEKEFKRRLTAILNADVVGYSRLMQDDEEATIRTLTSYRNAISNLILQYRGRVVDSPGDNLLAEFTSVVDAVNCAVEIQRDLAERNAEMPENRKMEFRIGVNLGDVFDEGERIYGDGINIAARMETLAEVGGICISGTVYDAIENKIGLEYEYLGEQEVKNIAKPIRAYQVLSFPGAAAHRVIRAKKAVGKTWRNVSLSIVSVVILVVAVGIWYFYFRPPPIEPASVEKMAFPLPGKPSIAVLPFVNMSADPKQEYFSDGITEEIITGLSKVPGVFVIARQSTFSYKGKPVKVQKVAEDLGVHYILEGSVRKAEDHVRITAQLIDALPGHHVWTGRYDRNLKDIFQIYDEITIKIMEAIQIKLTDGEIARYRSRGVGNIEAYEKYLEAKQYLFDMSRDNLTIAKNLAEKLITIDEDYSAAYQLISWIIYWEVYYGWSSPESLEEALKYCQKSLSLDESNVKAHDVASHIYRMFRNWGKSRYHAQRAFDLAPGNSQAIFGLGAYHHSAGDRKEGVRLMEKAIRLDPLSGPWAWYMALGWAYYLLENYEKAIEIFEKGVEKKPDDITLLSGLAATYAMMGLEEKSKKYMSEVMRIDPKTNIEHWSKILPFKKRADIDLMLEGCREAGMPEKPPLPLPDKPSIAVLPFDNLSKDPEQEYFSDGMTDDIITDLSKVSGLFVIARNSVFTYKGKSVKVDQIGRELGVQYLLEGSVRKVGQEVRINAQLIDATKGHHLWAERYDGSLKDIFALQDSITKKIVTALAIKLSSAESGLITQRDTDNLEAYDAYLKARDHHIRYTPEDIKKAASYYQKAIALDPEYSQAYAAYGYFILTAPTWWSGVPRNEFYKSIPEYLRISMKKPNPGAYVFSSSIKASMHLLHERYEELRQGSILFPNDASILLSLTDSLIGIGKPEEGVALAEKAMRLDPRYLGHSLYTLGLAYYAMQDSEKAVSYFQRSLKHNPQLGHVQVPLAAAYAHLGRLQEAREMLNTYTSKYKWTTLRQLFLFIHKGDPNFVERFANDLLKAGIQGEPDGYYKIFDKNRLMGDELKELLQDTQSFEYSIENNMICARWTLFGDCCRPVFRNPEGTLEEHNEYFLENYFGVDLVSTPDDLNKLIELKTGSDETFKRSFINWTSADDGVCREGIFIRKNPPSFSFKYPSDYTVCELDPGQICKIRSKSAMPIIYVYVAKNQDNPQKTLSRSAEITKRYIQKNYDREAKIIYTRAIPENTYGEKYPAQEYEIEFKSGGYPMTSYTNVIIKNDYRIAMSGADNSFLARDNIEKIIKPIFNSIDLEP